MADSLGFGSAIFLGLGSVWGTPVQATQCVPARSFADADTQYAQISDGTLKGFGDERTPDQGPLTVGLSGETRLRYRLNNLLLRAFFGSLATNRYTLLDSLTGVMLTAVLLRGGGVAPLITEYDSVKIIELTLSSTPEDGTLLSFTGMGRTFTDSSVLNTVAVLEALINTVDANCLHDDWNIRIGDQVDALAAGDSWSPSEWEMSLARPMDETHVTQFIEEPVDDGFKELSLSFTLPRLTSLQFRTWRNAQTRLQARFFATGPGSKTLEILVPNMIVSSWSGDVAGPEHIPQEIECLIKAGVDTLTSIAIDASTTDDSFNSAALFPVLYPGAIIWVSGFVASGNNGRFVVASATTSKIIVTPSNLVTEAAGASVTLRSQNPSLIITEA